MKTGLLNSINCLSFLLLVLVVPLLIITMTVTGYIHSPGLYEAGFRKYHITEATGIDEAQLGNVAHKMVDYFSGRSSTPQMEVISHGLKRELYNEKELIHLEDVRSIIRIFSLLQFVSIAAFIFLVLLVYIRSGTRRALTGIQMGAIVGITCTGILAAWALIDFNSLFLLFHYISFSNDLWILDPHTDYLIMMFPEGFFNDSATMIVGSILAEAVIIWLAAFLINRAIAKHA